MRPIIRFIAIAMMATSLSACESVKQDKEVEVVQTAPAMSDDQIQQTYSDVLKNTGDGSVQVFSLDDNDMSAPYQDHALAVTPTPMLPQGQGQQFGDNSHVTVFPLDGAPTYGAGVYDTRGAIPPMLSPDNPLMPTPLNAQSDGIARIYFKHGATGVNNVGKEVSSAVASQCRAGGCGLVKVEGHASTRAVAKDEIQRRIINLKISMDRAMNVTRQLIRDGVPADAIQVTAHGDRVPPVVVPSDDAEAAARRVEIITGSPYPQY